MKDSEKDQKGNSGPQNVKIRLWWAAMLPTLRATGLNHTRPALSNQNDPCRHIRHFCGDKVFAVATIWRNML